MKVLITGANGQLGRCLQDAFSGSAFDVIAADRAMLNIVKKDDVDLFFNEKKPEFVINAAAYTAVDQAEDEPEQAYLVNAEAPAYLASACSKLGIPLIHISTDYVFDGKASQPYPADAVTNPINVYGKSKLAGEQNVAKSLAQSLIIRTSWVFSEYGNNFVKTMLRLAGSRNQLSVVDDQFGCPTYAGHLALEIRKVTESYRNGQGMLTGIHHFSGGEVVSWYDFAKEIFQCFENARVFDGGIRVLPISSSQFPTKSNRPKYTAMAYSGLGSLNEKYPWRQALERIVTNWS